MKYFLALILSAVAFGQALPATTPGDFYALWLNGTEGVHPALTGDFSIAHPIDKNDDYWFTNYGISTIKSPTLPYQTTVTTGVATKLKQFGTIKVFAVILGGVAVSGNAAGGATSGKILVDIPIGKSPWRILIAPFNVDKTQLAGGAPKSVMIGFGRTF